MIRGAPIATMILTVGCATEPAHPAAPPPATVAPVVASAASARPALPPGASEGVRQASLLGELIYRQDGWAARATDRLAQEHVLDHDDRLRGWVITHEGDGGTAHFIGAGGAGLATLYRVVFSGPLPNNERLERLDPPAPLTASLERHFKARETAIRSPFKRFTKDVNTVTLPASLIGKSGWLVYLLAATSDPGEILLGGHTRCHISEDGETMLAIEPLSKTILRLPIDSQVVGVTHMVTDWPLETHVFASLLYRRPILVATQMGLWEVNGTVITFKGQIK